MFTQFDGDGEGNYSELDSKNIDTGMGLERLATVVQGVDSIFDIDTMKAIRDKVSQIAGVTYLENPKQDISIRLITDHVRAVTWHLMEYLLMKEEATFLKTFKKSSKTR